jgi:hypothetical protein
MKPFRIVILLLNLIFFSKNLFSQKIDQGNFLDFDYGAHGVYGAHRLNKTTFKEFWQLSRLNDSTAKAIQINAAGIAFTTVLVTFKNGSLSHQEEINQWGDTIRHKNFQPLGQDSFKVTHFINGINAYLPCKYAKVIYKNELLVEESLYSHNGSPKDNWLGYSIVRYKRYDDKNRFSETREASYFNAKNQPVIANRHDLHRITYEYDENTKMISEAFFGSQDEPIAIRNGDVSHCKYFYTKDGNHLRDEYYGLDGKRTLSENGISAIDYTYEKGFKVKVVRRDSLNQINRSAATGDGIAIIKWEYDDKGNQTKESYFDEQDQPINNQMGIHTETETYSPDNMLVETSFYDIHDAPALNQNKIHATHYVRNRIGRAIEEYSVGLDGKMVGNFNDQVYIVRTGYDAVGQEISYSYWQDSITPMPRWNGAYKTEYKYNEDGQLSEYNYYDRNGSLFKTADSVSTVQSFYQEDGQLYKRQFLYNGELANHETGASSGYAIIRFDYDNAGRTSELHFYGINHEAVDASIEINEKVNAHRIVFLYKGLRVIEQWYYKMNSNEPFLKLDCLNNDFLEATGVSIGRKNSN